MFTKRWVSMLVVLAFPLMTIPRGVQAAVSGNGNPAVCNVNVTAGFNGSGINITSSFTQNVYGVYSAASGVLTYFGAKDTKDPLMNGSITPTGPAGDGLADLTYTSSQPLTLVLDFKNHRVAGGMLRGDPLSISSPNSLTCTSSITPPSTVPFFYRMINRSPVSAAFVYTITPSGSKSQSTPEKLVGPGIDNVYGRLQVPQSTGYLGHVVIQTEVGGVVLCSNKIATSGTLSNVSSNVTLFEHSPGNYSCQVDLWTN